MAEGEIGRSLGRRRWIVVVLALAAVAAGAAVFRWVWPGMQPFIDDPSRLPADPATVKRALNFDTFVFLPVYVLLVSLACLLPTSRTVRYRGVGRQLAFLAYLAGACDLVENLLAREVLDGDANAVNLLRYATAAKLALITVPALFGLLALLAWAAGRIRVPVVEPGATEKALTWAKKQRLLPPISRAARLGCWIRGDAQTPPRPPLPDTATPQGKMGACFSGGGIRSAAFNLGAIQELQASHELDKCDYTSAVSGGAYMACAHAITTGWSADSTGIRTVPAFAPGTVEEQYLRNRTTYLFPGLIGFSYAMWRLVRGLAVNVGFIAIVLFVLARPYGWAMETRLDFEQCRVKPVESSTVIEVPGQEECPPASDRVDATKRDVKFDAYSWAAWPVLVLGGLAVLLGLIDMLTRPRERPAARLEAWSFRLLGFAFAAAVLLYVFPWLAAVLFRDTTFHGSSLDRLPAGTAFGGAISALVTMAAMLRRLGPKRPTGETQSATGDRTGLASKVVTAVGKLGDGMLRLLMIVVGGIVGPVALAAGFLAIAMGGMIDGGFEPDQLGTWLLVIAVFLLINGVGDANRWSLQPFYKRKLQTAFVLRREGQDDGSVIAEEIPFNDPLPITNLPRKPELVVCAAVNLTDYGLLPPGRPVSTFTFSRTEVDGGVLPSVDSGVLATLLGPHYERDFTVPAAMAASGAAVSPVMGKMTKPAFRFLLALTNVRLGVWLPNPKPLLAWAQRQPVDDFRGYPWLPRPTMLFHELLGFYRSTSRFVYVTDGGHYENLGLVELIRRGCEWIYCFDAAGDRIDRFSTVADAVSIARTELGVRIDIDPTEMAPPPGSQYNPVSHVTGRIVYPGPEAKIGHIVFAKLGVTEDVPPDVKSWRETHPTFPTDGTADQLYTDQRFEAYRALGSVTAVHAINAMRQIRGEPPYMGPAPLRPAPSRTARS